MPRQTLILTRYLALVSLICPVFSYAQVDNGSFEEESQPSLQSWSFSCEGTSFQEAPPGGGTWSLKLEPGNTQGCFPGQAVQTIPAVENGEVWRLTAWAKLDSNSRTRASVYWKVSSPTETPVIPSVDTTSSRSWTQLIVIDTLYLAEGDSASIVLDAGLTGGPTVVNSAANFDLIIAEKIGEVPVSTEGQEQPGNAARHLLQNFPNPFLSQTVIPFHLAEQGHMQLTIYDVLGRIVVTLANKSLPRGLHEVRWDSRDAHGKAMPSGMYLYRMQTPTFAEERPMILVR